MKYKHTQTQELGPKKRHKTSIWHTIWPENSVALSTLKAEVFTDIINSYAMANIPSCIFGKSITLKRKANCVQPNTSSDQLDYIIFKPTLL